MSYYCFVTKNGEWIGLDQASGGYPYKTDFPNDIKLWKTIPDAKKYQECFPREDWILKEFFVSLKDI